MSDWLYDYFAADIASIIFHKKDVVAPSRRKSASTSLASSGKGRALAKHPIFMQSKVHTPKTMWIRPVDPTLLLMDSNFLNPTCLWRPQVFLWLIHLFIELKCPDPLCGKPLEKNGALPPWRVTDIEDSFYIVAWAYYCCDGCHSYYHGWSKKLIDSLPPQLRLAFPAVLSRKSGLSHAVIDILRAGNQHKMGSNGVRSLLYETHTRRFNKVQLQYLESVFEHVQVQDIHTTSSCDAPSSSTSPPVSAFFAPSQCIPDFGNFGDVQCYGGFVPSERYLSAMLNKAIECDEADANQHTACLKPDQLAIDDSHKVG